MAEIFGAISIGFQLGLLALVTWFVTIVGIALVYGHIEAAIRIIKKL